MPFQKALQFPYLFGTSLLLKEFTMFSPCLLGAMADTPVLQKNSTAFSWLPSRKMHPSCG